MPSKPLAPAASPPTVPLGAASVPPLRVRSQLRPVGLPELVARDLADYEARALCAWRETRKNLPLIRARLAVNRRTQPLFDMARYARDFEDRLLHIAHEHAQGQRG